MARILENCGLDILYIVQHVPRYYAIFKLECKYMAVHWVCACTGDMYVHAQAACICMHLSHVFLLALC